MNLCDIKNLTVQGTNPLTEITATGLTLDLTRHILDETIWGKLLEWARDAELQQKISALFTHNQLNPTEQRAAGHTWLRAAHAPDRQGTAPFAADIRAVHRQMCAFVKGVQTGEMCGTHGAPFRHVVVIGIGGSFLGPKLLCEFLAASHNPKLAVHFVASPDALADLDNLPLAKTLVIVQSKTFTTFEVLLNANTLKKRFVAAGLSVGTHFCAVTANMDAAQDFGIAPARIFAFWDWVGGRYSVWSAVGLAAMLAFGEAAFFEFLDGARAMDAHVASAPLAENAAVVLALLSLWYMHGRGATNRAILLYAHALRSLVPYVQQLEMESNGKGVRADGEQVAYPTAPLVWGGVGIEGQHAYFQWLHQGSGARNDKGFATMLEFIGIADGHPAMLASLAAQRDVFWHGGQGADEQHSQPNQHNQDNPHRAITGGKPSTTILLPSLTAHALGALLALYEHRVFVEATLLGINPFDQFGVEAGKALLATRW